MPQIPQQSVYYLTVRELNCRVLVLFLAVLYNQRTFLSILKSYQNNIFKTKQR